MHPMPEILLSWRGVKARVVAALDAALHSISLYVLPLAIALVTAAALLAWDAKYTDGGASGLSLRVVEQTAG